MTEDRTIEYSFDALGDLRARLPLVELSVPVGERSYRVVSVEDQDWLVERVRTEDDLANFPFGLMLWASAAGLAEALATDPICRLLAREKRVLEIGCGVGLAGLAARAQAGAASVVQTDYQTDALTLAAHNAAINRIDGVSQRIGDWRAFPESFGRFDLVIGSDVLYERSLHTTLADLLPRLITPGGTILLSDPLRPQALEWIEAREKSGRWRIAMDGLRVDWEGASKDVALFRMTAV